METISEQKIIRALTGNYNENLTTVASFIVKHISDKNYDNLENRIKLFELCVALFLQKNNLKSVKFQLNIDPEETDTVANFYSDKNLLEVFTEALESHTIDFVISCAAHECQHIAQKYTCDMEKRIGESSQSLTRKARYDFLQVKDLFDTINAMYSTSFQSFNLGLAFYNNTQIETEARNSQFDLTENILNLARKCNKKYQSKISHPELVDKAIQDMIREIQAERDDDKRITSNLEKNLKKQSKAISSIVQRYQKDIATFIDDEIFAKGADKPQATKAFLRNFDKFKTSLTIAVNKPALNKVLDTLYRAKMPKLAVEILDLPNLEISQDQTDTAIQEVINIYNQANQSLPLSLRNMLTMSVAKRYLQQNLINLNQQELEKSIQNVEGKMASAEKAQSKADTAIHTREVEMTK